MVEQPVQHRGRPSLRRRRRHSLLDSPPDDFSGGSGGRRVAVGSRNRANMRRCAATIAGRTADCSCPLAVGPGYRNNRPARARHARDSEGRLGAEPRLTEGVVAGARRLRRGFRGAPPTERALPETLHLLAKSAGNSRRDSLRSATGIRADLPVGRPRPKSAPVEYRGSVEEPAPSGLFHRLIGRSRRRTRRSTRTPLVSKATVCESPRTGKSPGAVRPRGSGREGVGSRAAVVPPEGQSSINWPRT